MNQRLNPEFFRRNVLEVARDLPGKILVRKFDNGLVKRYVITETEAYSGDGDLACHASKGRTPRTEVMFRNGGLVYVYLIYGIHWLLNVVAGKPDDASAVLISCLEGFNGPGLVGRELQLDKSFYGEDLFTSERLWIEDSEIKAELTTLPRVGIQYAGEPWISKPWRFVLTHQE